MDAIVSESFWGDFLVAMRFNTPHSLYGGPRIVWFSTKIGTPSLNGIVHNSGCLCLCCQHWRRCDALKWNTLERVSPLNNSARVSRELKTNHLQTGQVCELHLVLSSLNRDGCIFDHPKTGRTYLSNARIKVSLAAIALLRWNDFLRVQKSFQKIRVSEFQLPSVAASSITSGSRSRISTSSNGWRPFVACTCELYANVTASEHKSQKWGWYETYDHRADALVRTAQPDHWRAGDK